MISLEDNSQITSVHEISISPSEDTLTSGILTGFPDVLSKVEIIFRVSMKEFRVLLETSGIYILDSDMILNHLVNGFFDILEYFSF